MRLGGWVVMLTIMIIFLSIMGIETGLTTVLNTLGITIGDGTFGGGDISISPFWSTIITALAVLSGAGIIVGLFAKGYDPSLVIAPIIVFIGTLYVPTFISVINYTSALNQWWITALIYVIFGGLMVGFAMSLMDYFAGR